VSKKYDVKPMFTLGDHWAYGINTLNWIIYQRAIKKDGSGLGPWRAVAYYGCPVQMLTDLRARIMRTDTGDPTMDALLKRNHATAMHMATTFTQTILDLPDIPKREEILTALKEENQ